MSTFDFQPSGDMAQFEPSGDNPEDVELVCFVCHPPKVLSENVRNLNHAIRLWCDHRAEMAHRIDPEPTT